jgi:hypothetical protein
MSILAKAGIAALIALGAASTSISTASARDVSVSIHQVRYDPHRPRICSPVLAVQKARERGMRYAHITNITPRRVVVEGRDRRGPDRIAFANVPGCPLIRR